MITDRRWHTALLCTALFFLAACHPGDESLQLNPSTRAELGGSYVSLTDGVTHYELSGPVSGPVVVLVHGYTAAQFVWDPVAEALANAGYRVLRYDLFGHGYSDRPETAYSPELYRRQLSELVDAVLPLRPIYLVGWSMGCMIAADYASAHAKKLSGLSLIAPAAMANDLPLITRAAAWPGLGEFSMSMLGSRSLREEQARFFVRQDGLPEYMAEFEKQMVFEGFQRAMLEILRDMPLTNFRDGYQQLDRLKLPVQLLWGDQDDVTPYANHVALRGLLPQAEFISVKNLGHASFYEQPEAVLPHLQRFISFVQSAPQKKTVISEAARRLSQALQFKTISNQTGSNQDSDAAFNAFYRFLKKAFPLTFSRLKIEPLNGPSLLLHWQGSDSGARPIMLMAHQDVVPIETGTEGGWTHPPYSGYVDGEYIWGRGSLDDKGALLAILEAVESLLQQGYEPERGIYLAFGHDEEDVSSNRGIALGAKLLRERGVRLSFVLDEGGAIVSNVMPGVRSPVALIGVAQKGYLSLRLKVQGSGGHSSMPPNTTSVSLLANALTRLTSEPFAASTRFVEPLFESVAAELPLGQRLVLSNLWLTRSLVQSKLSASPATNALIRTTIAPTMLAASNKENVLASQASSIVNFRVIPGDSIEAVVERVRERIADERVEVEILGTPAKPTRVHDVDSASYSMLKAAILETVESANMPPVMPVPSLVVTATDSRHFEDLADNIYRFNFNRLDITDLKRIHGTDERVAIYHHEQAINFYRRLINKLSAGDERR